MHSKQYMSTLTSYNISNQMFYQMLFFSPFRHFSSPQCPVIQQTPSTFFTEINGKGLQSLSEYIEEYRRCSNLTRLNFFFFFFLNFCTTASSGNILHDFPRISVFMDFFHLETCGFHQNFDSVPVDLKKVLLHRMRSCCAHFRGCWKSPLNHLDI